MRHLLILVVLFLSATTFSQTTADTTKKQTPATSFVVQKVDSIQTARIEDIEKRLSAFYTYNRRSHTILYLSLGISTAGVLIASGNSYSKVAPIMLYIGSFVGLVGTVIYLDSYKFLNFKPKRREIREMTYY
jgi:hypothetical protein